MKSSFRQILCTHVACLSLWPILAFAQSPDLSQDLEACKAGSEACDPSKLSAAQETDVALARHARNVANCRNGRDSCDHSQLTGPETIALAVADHQRNVSDCNDGMQSCDRSKLTPAEARNSSAAERQRNVARHLGRESYFARRVSIELLATESDCPQFAARGG